MSRFRSKLLQPVTLESLICPQKVPPRALPPGEPEAPLDAYLDMLDLAVEGVRHHIPRKFVGS